MSRKFFDPEEVYISCFEADWKHTRIPELVKHEAQLPWVKALLRDAYVNRLYLNMCVLEYVCMCVCMWRIVCTNDYY